VGLWPAPTMTRVETPGYCRFVPAGTSEAGRVASRKAGEDGLVASKRSEDGRELIS